MRKIVYIFLSLTIVLFICCNKKSNKDIVTPEGKPGEYNLDGSPRFLKSIAVSEAEKITFDSVGSNFTITLPKDYAQESINIKLSLYSDVKIEEGVSPAKSDTTLKFAFEGSAPLRLTLVAANGAKKGYLIYVNHTAQPQIELLNTEISINASFIKLPIKIITGVGTTPSAPTLKNPSIKLINRKNNAVIEGLFYNNLGEISISDISGLVNASQYALEIQFGNQKTFVFENIRFRRGLPSVTIAGYQNVLSPSKDSILAFGGYFSPAEKYQVEFSSDFLAQPVLQEMKFIDSSRVTTTLPKGIAEGSYLVTFYENKAAIGKNSLYLSESKTHSIETIWQGSPNNALSRNTTNSSFAKGETFYAKPWPLVFGSSSQLSSFNVKDLPILRLKSGATTVDLAPELTVVNWAVAGLNFSVGKYTIPKTIQSGSYQATLVFPDKIESKPYWSKIEIR